MTDAPERIWVDLFDEPMGPWCGDAFSTDSGDVSYVRADLFDAKEAEIADLRRQLAERDYLIAAAGDYAAKLERQLAEALESARAAVVAVEAEIDARHAYEDLPTDRGGRDGPKGKAYARWLDRRASVFAAIRALKGAAK